MVNQLRNPVKGEMTNYGENVKRILIQIYNYTYGKEVTRNPLKNNFTGIWLDLKICPQHKYTKHRPFIQI